MASYHHHVSHETQYPQGGPQPAPLGFQSSPPPPLGYQGYFYEGNPPPPHPTPARPYPPYHHFHGGSGCLSFLKACLAGLCCCCFLEECCY